MFTRTPNRMRALVWHVSPNTRPVNNANTAHWAESSVGSIASTILFSAFTETKRRFVGPTVLAQDNCHQNLRSTIFIACDWNIQVPLTRCEPWSCLLSDHLDYFYPQNRKIQCANETEWCSFVIIGVLSKARLKHVACYRILPAISFRS